MMGCDVYVETKEPLSFMFQFYYINRSSKTDISTRSRGIAMTDLVFGRIVVAFELGLQKPLSA